LELNLISLRQMGRACKRSDRRVIGIKGEEVLPNRFLCRKMSINYNRGKGENGYQVNSVAKEGEKPCKRAEKEKRGKGSDLKGNRPKVWERGSANQSLLLHSRWDARRKNRRGGFTENGGEMERIRIQDPKVYPPPYSTC